MALTESRVRFETGRAISGLGELLPVVGGAIGFLSYRPLLLKIFAGAIGFGVGKAAERYLRRFTPRSF